MRIAEVMDEVVSGRNEIGTHHILNLALNARVKGHAEMETPNGNTVSLTLGKAYEDGTANYELTIS